MKPQFKKLFGMGALLATLAALILVLPACNPTSNNSSNGGGGGCPATYNLRADVFTKTMPDGRVVTMWGYAQDSSFNALDGVVTSPGPVLVVPAGCSKLVVHLKNNLTAPTSLVIDGLTAHMVPVIKSNGRVRSFTHETPSGNPFAVEYVWNSVRPGTFLYKSGTNVQVQEQMGLYGGMIQDSSTGNIYPGVPYTKQVPLFFSEVDPDLHDAVATGNYGPGKTITSTLNYSPQYFLINGSAFVQGSSVPINVGAHSDTILLRMINAGSFLHSPEIYGLYQNVVAEDGNQYTYPKNLYSILLTAGKTKDTIIAGPAAGNYVLYDRALSLYNGPGVPFGGMMTQFTITP